MGELFSGRGQKAHGDRIIDGGATNEVDHFPYIRDPMHGGRDRQSSTPGAGLAVSILPPGEDARMLASGGRGKVVTAPDATVTELSANRRIERNPGVIMLVRLGQNDEGFGIRTFVYKSHHPPQAMRVNFGNLRPHPDSLTRTFLQTSTAAV